MEDNKKAAIEKIYLLTKQDVEFNEELRKKLGIASSASSAIADDERLNQIYEYCIEDIISKQAEEFYKDFPIPELQDQLRADFRKMELFRRKNSFDDFCLSVYQQIENITNFLCEDESFNEVAQKMWAYPAYLRQGEGITPKLEERSSIYGKPYYAIAHLVFIGKDEQGHPNSIIRTAKPLREQFAWDKIRNVVYFIGYKAEMIYRFLLALTYYDQYAAEELTQETFYQAFLSFGRFRGECSLRTWLFQIAKNIYAKYVRRESHQRDIAARRSEEAVPPPTAEIEQKEMLTRIRTLLDELEEPARSIMQYRLYSDSSYAEIAYSLNIRANTAAVIYNRTVAKLRTAMKERYGYEV